MRELSENEIEDVSGGFLVNLGMGFAGMTSGMASYALSGGISGRLSGIGFATAAVGGFVFGAGGFNGASAYAGAAAAGATAVLLEEDS